MGSYVFLAILGMVAYSITTIFVKIAARGGFRRQVRDLGKRDRDIFGLPSGH